MHVAVFTLQDLDIAGGSWLRIVGPTQYLAELGCRVTLLSPNLPKPLEGKVEHVHVRGQPGNPEPFRRLLLLQAASPLLQAASRIVPFYGNLPRLINALRPDVIHCHRHSAGLLLLRFLHRLNAPVALDLHTMYRLQLQPAANLRGRVARALTLRAEARMIQNMDAIVLESPAYKDYVAAEFGVPSERIFVAPSGADVAFLSQSVAEKEKNALREELGLRGKRVILFGGSFKPQSGVLDLVAAFQRLRASHPDAALVLIGSVEDMAEDERADFRKLDMREATCVGRQSRERYRLFQQIADAIVVPDRDAPFARLFAPLKLYDALASRKPVVVARVASRAEMIEDGVTGFLVEPNNPASMAEGLARALDARNAQEIGERAAAMVAERCSFRETARRMLRAYEEILSRRR